MEDDEQHKIIGKLIDQLDEQRIKDLLETLDRLVDSKQHEE